MVNKAGDTLTKSFEGLRLKAYKDSGGIWTIGRGHTSDKYFKVTSTSSVTELEAEDLFRRDMIEAEQTLQRELPNWKGLNENQYAACVDFVFNRGTLNWKSGKHTTIYYDLIEQNYTAAANEFLSFTKDIKGNVLAGLLKRRKAERALFTTPVGNTEFAVDMIMKYADELKPRDLDYPHNLADEVFEMNFV